MLRLTFSSATTLSVAETKFLVQLARIVMSAIVLSSLLSDRRVLQWLKMMLPSAAPVRESRRATAALVGASNCCSAISTASS